MPRSESPLRSDLFPEISPYASGMQAVDGRHTIYWEQSGNPDGVPVLFLHGGPGAGSAPVHRRFFDPQFYRIVVFDQRGCGRSMPLGELHDNTTGDLVADINPTFSWVRLAQRVPVRIKLDPGPLDVHLIAGRTATVVDLSYQRGVSQPQRSSP